MFLLYIISGELISYHSLCRIPPNSIIAWIKLIFAFCYKNNFRLLL